MIEGQMGSQPLNGADARAVLGIVWQWIDGAKNGRSSDVDVLERALRQAGYAPLEEQ